MSKQANWAAARKAAGNCCLCLRPLYSTTLCKQHLLATRERKRNEYRRARNIPLNALLFPQGRKPILT